MPATFQIIFGLLAILLVLGGYSTVRRRAARRDHGRDLDKGKPSDGPEA